MGIRDALRAGGSALTRPIRSASEMLRQAMSGVTASDLMPGMKAGAACRTTPHNRPASEQPIAPPAREMAVASPNTIPRIAAGVKPSVFRMPTSRTRSRTDMEMVFPETSRMVNATAPQIAARNSRSEEHTSELQSLRHLVCRLLLEKKKKKHKNEEQSSTE